MIDTFTLCFHKTKLLFLILVILENVVERIGKNVECGRLVSCNYKNRINEMGN